MSGQQNQQIRMLQRSVQTKNHYNTHSYLLNNAASLEENKANYSQILKLQQMKREQQQQEKN